MNLLSLVLRDSVWETAIDNHCDHIPSVIMIIIYIEQGRDRNIPALEFLYSTVVWIILSEMDWILLRNILLFHIVTL